MSITPEIPVETQPVAIRRHALGLPAGSVRAILALGVLGLMWGIVLRYQYGGVPLSSVTLPLPFIYLQFLMILILAHYFGSHGSTIGPHLSSGPPLGLPHGSVRFVLVAGYLGLAGYLYYAQPDFAFPPKGPFVLLVGLLITGFFLGHVITGCMRLIGRGQLPDWFLDFEAWIALLALFALSILIIVYLFINPSVSEQNRLDLPTLESFLAAAVGFYFGARS